MKITKQFVAKKLSIAFLTMIFMVLLVSTAFALPPYTNASSNGSTSVYVMPNSSSITVGSIGVESVKVYWQESGYYYIEYVVSGGAYGGYKRGYVPTSKINVSGISVNTYPAWGTKTYSNQTVYDRSATNSYVIGSVLSTDNISIIREDGSWYFIQYPVTGGYKRGYVPKITVNSNITSGYTQTMAQNGAWMWSYAQVDVQQGTYPIGTGYEFVNRVKTNGVWDYKQVFTSGYSYNYNGSSVSDEDLGNMHYGYVGRFAGFGRTLLSSAAGVYQICSGTWQTSWYSTYFDDPNDQHWIDYGMNMYDYYGLPSSLAAKSATTPAAISAESDTPKFDPTLFTPEQINALLTPEQQKEIKTLAIENSKKIKNKQPLDSK